VLGGGRSGGRAGGGGGVPRTAAPSTGPLCGLCSTDGLTVLAKLRELAGDAHVVVMTAHGTMETAIQAMQRGAYDYLAKPFDLDEVLLVAERALAAGRLTQEVARLKTGLQEVWEFGALIGRHPRMQEVYKTIGRIAASEVTVLLHGESGTGKELVARAIHHYSRRAGRAFVAVSSAAIPGTLLEPELFDHERGAFTDAKERKLGKLELAQRDAAAALAQRRQREGDDVEPVEEVLAELSLAHEGLEVAVGGRQDAHVDPDGVLTAHALDGALLQGAEQLGRGRAGREAAAARRATRDRRQPGPRRSDPRHQPQHPAKEADGARDRS
jgi:CheY-like chemotaxis protein